ncbi:MAG: transposase [Chloroflexi bacterium]|nr:transposase [Chloroflexota bacterium]MBU1751553.1 transposase [Chloroflexota bacterium]
MQLVEQHVIKTNHPAWHEVDQAAFAAKNLYNRANYVVRQQFFATDRILSYGKLYRLFKDAPEYQVLPRKVSQQVLRLLAQNWRAFWHARAEYRHDPTKFLGPPRIPNYLDKQTGRFVLVYTAQAISQQALRQGCIQPSGLPLTVPTRHQRVNQVRIVPKKTHYVLEVVYTVDPEPALGLDPALIAGVDIGLNNLAAIASNQPGFVPLVVNGRPLKSLNQFYHKRQAQLQSHLPAGQHESQRLDRLGDKRTRRIHHYLHTASRRIIDHLAAAGIGTLVIGKNPCWKQQINIGKRNNQHFASVPHARFVDMLAYKAELVGIQVVLVEESYTSKTSFLDWEPPCQQDTYAGRRVQRGLFQAADGRPINADVNGAYQIIRKAFPDAFPQRDRGCVVHPMPLGIN